MNRQSNNTHGGKAATTSNDAEASRAAAAPCATSSNPYETGPFREVADMESPLTVAKNLLHGLAMIAETLGEHEGEVVQQIAGLAIKEIRAADALRSKLFRLTHPRRAEFVATGEWSE